MAEDEPSALETPWMEKDEFAALRVNWARGERMLGTWHPRQRRLRSPITNAVSAARRYGAYRVD